MSLLPPRIQSIGLPFTLTKNSTTYDFHLSGTILGHAASFDWFVKNGTDGYSKKITMAWNLFSTLTVALTLNNVNGHQVMTDSEDYCVGSTCFNFGDIMSICTLVSNVLTCTLAAGIHHADPLALDTGLAKSCTLVNTCTTAGFTRTTTNEILYLGVGINAGQTVSTVTDTLGNTWAKRKQVALPTATGAGSCSSGITCELETWWTLSASAASRTVTVTSTGGSTCCTIDFRVDGITGANTATPFDANPSVPCSATATATQPSCPISTNLSNDFIIGEFVKVGTCLMVCTPGGAFSSMGVSNSVILGLLGEYNIVSTIQNSLAVTVGGVTCSATITCAIVGDAITANSAFTRAVSDTFTFSDSIARAGVFARSASDTFTFSDSISKGKAVALADTFAFADSIARAGAFTRGLTDTFSFADSVTCVLNAVVCVVTINVSDPPNYLWLFMIPLVLLLFLVVRKVK